MSQDNENKPGEFDFDADAAGQGTPFNDDNFDPFNDNGFSFGDVEATSNDAALSEPAAEEILSDDFGAPSSFLTGEGSAEGDFKTMEEAEEPVSKEEETDAKSKKKKKKEKAKKEKKPKSEKKKKEKKSREPGDKEPIGLGGILCLAFGLLLLLGLIVGNVIILMTDAKELGVGASSVMYYLIGMDVIGLIGIVSVPFLFFLYRKDIDVFKVSLGVSAMAMSLGVLLLMTAFFRYDFTIKAPASMPSTDIPVSTPAVPAE